MRGEYGGNVNLTLDQTVIQPKVNNYTQSYIIEDVEVCRERYV